MRLCQPPAPDHLELVADPRLGDRGVIRVHGEVGAVRGEPQQGVGVGLGEGDASGHQRARRAGLNKEDKVSLYPDEIWQL